MDSNRIFDLNIKISFYKGVDFGIIELLVMTKLKY